MQAWLRRFAGAGFFREQLKINGTPIAAVAAVWMNLRRERSDAFDFIVQGLCIYNIICKIGNKKQIPHLAGLENIILFCRSPRLRPDPEYSGRDFGGRSGSRILPSRFFTLLWFLRLFGSSF